jgi:hypothetical protein
MLTGCAMCSSSAAGSDTVRRTDMNSGMLSVLLLPRCAFSSCCARKAVSGWRGMLFTLSGDLPGMRSTLTVT